MSHSLALKLPVYIVFSCAILALVIGVIGYKEFKSLSENEYAKFSNQFAYTAFSFIDAEKVSEYAKTGQLDLTWFKIDRKLRNLTDIGYLASIHVTVPDTENYETQTYIFDTVNKSIFSNARPHILGEKESLLGKSEEFINQQRLLMELGIAHSEYITDEVMGGYVQASIPITNAKGDSVAVLTVIKPMSEVLFLRQRYIRSTVLASVGFMVVFVAIFGFIIMFHIIRPLRFITFETSHFAEHGGTLSGVLKKIKNKDEFGLLAQSVEKMSVDMMNYINKLTQMTAEKERLSAELDVATEIQANMLPSLYPAFPERNDFDLYANMTPAKEVGGDLYDYMLLDDDHIMLAVGDVSGKGVPAALFMVITKTLLSSHAVQGLSPVEIFEATNNQLCENNEAGMFVTCWLAILTLSTGELRFVNAAHPNPILYANGEFNYLNTKPNLMLGGMAGMKYKEHTITLKHGDRLFIYTDGVTEATDKDNVLFAEERLLKAAKETLALNTKDTVEYIKKSIDSFIGTVDQFDDITMLDFIYR